MPYATLTNDASVRNQTLAMIVDILAKMQPADRIHTVCWSTVKPNAFVAKDLPAILASASISTNVLQIHAQQVQCAPTFQGVTPVNVQAVALETHILGAAPNPLYILAVIRTRAPPVKSVSRMRTVATVSAFAARATNVTLKAFAETSMNVKTRTNRRVASTQFAKTCQEAMNVNVRQDSTETHSCRAKNATAWNASALRRTSLWMEIVFWIAAPLMASVLVERNVSRSPEA